MKSCLLTLLTFLSVSTAAALGTLPNGKYSGKMTCTSSKQSFQCDSFMTVEDTTLLTVSSCPGSDPQSNLKTFVIDSAGFFTFTTDIGEKGSGYVTAHGIHTDAVFNGIPGEDTFFFMNNSLYLISSATVPGEKFKCEGVFKGVS